MFPTAYSSVYRNEAGEPLGWDNTCYAEREPEYYDCCGVTGRCRCDDDDDYDRDGSGNDDDDL